MVARALVRRSVAFVLTLGACVQPADQLAVPPAQAVGAAAALDCTGLGTPENPSALSATVGVPGSVELQWPRTGAASFRACIDGARCKSVAASDVCTADRCTLSMNGLPNDVRAVARVQGENACTTASAVTAPSVSFTPLNTAEVSGDGFKLSSGCMPDVVALTNGEVRVDQVSPTCFSFLSVGDARWSDATLEVQVFIPTFAEAPFAGLAAQLNDEGHAVLGLVTAPPPELDRSTFLAFRRAGTEPPPIAASALFRAPPATWVTLRLVAQNGVFSFQSALPDGPITELVRWPSPLEHAALKSGRVGIAIAGAGKVRFRNFRVHTEAELPARGPQSVRYSFSSGVLPGDWFLNGRPTLDRRPCPELESATTCGVEGGCAPAPRSGCVYLSRNDFTGMGGTAAFDFPVGIDVSQPWSLSLRLAALEGSGGFVSPQFISTTHGTLLEVNGGASGSLVSAGTPLDVPLELGRWHRVKWTFQPDGRIDFELDGRSRPLMRPQAWDRHPGALSLSSGLPFSYFDAFLTDIEVVQQ
jgi:hypothetical protein